MEVPRHRVKSGTSFPSLSALADAVGTVTNPDHGFFAVLGAAIVFVKPASNEFVFIGHLTVGRFDRLPITAIDEDGKPVPLDTWFDDQSRTFNAYMEIVESQQPQQL